jgi:hypothetical protein
MQDLARARARAQLELRELEHDVATMTDGTPDFGRAATADELDYAPVAAEATA